MKIVGLDEKRVELVHKYQWRGLAAVAVAAALVAAIVCLIVIPDWEDDDFSYDHLFKHRHHHHLHHHRKGSEDHELQHLDHAEGAGDGKPAEEELFEDEVIETEKIVDDLTVNVNVNGAAVVPPAPAVSPPPVTQYKPSLEEDHHQELTQKDELHMLPLPMDADVHRAVSSLFIPGDDHPELEMADLMVPPALHPHPLSPIDQMVDSFMDAFAGPPPPIHRQVVRFYPGRSRVLDDEERVNVERQLHPIPDTVDDVMGNPLLIRSSLDPFGMLPGMHALMSMIGSGNIPQAEPEQEPEHEKNDPHGFVKMLHDLEDLFGAENERKEASDSELSLKPLPARMSIRLSMSSHIPDDEFESLMSKADAELAKLNRMQAESSQLTDTIGELVQHERLDEKLLAQKLNKDTDPAVKAGIPAEITMDHVMQEEKMAEDLMNTEDHKLDQIQRQIDQSNAMLEKIAREAQARLPLPVATGHYDNQEGIEPMHDGADPIDLDRLIPEDYLDDENVEFRVIPLDGAGVPIASESLSASPPQSQPGKITVLRLGQPRLLPMEDLHRPLMPLKPLHEIPLPHFFDVPANEEDKKPVVIHLSRLPAPFQMMPHKTQLSTTAPPAGEALQSSVAPLPALAEQGEDIVEDELSPLSAPMHMFPSLFDPIHVFNQSPLKLIPSDHHSMSPPAADEHKVGKKMLPEAKPLGEPPIRDDSFPSGLPHSPFHVERPKSKLFDQLFGHLFADDDYYTA